MASQVKALVTFTVKDGKAVITECAAQGTISEEQAAAIAAYVKAAQP